jgi:ribose transport system permease protein
MRGGPGTDGPETAGSVRAVAWRQMRRHMVWLVLAAIVAVLGLTLEPFWTIPNLLNVLNQTAIIALLAMGVTLVLVGGHFDLSVGAMLTLAAVVAIKLQPVDATGTLAAIVVPVLLGLAVGAVNGAFIGGLGANSIMVTVGMQLVLGGLTLVLVAGQHVRVDGAAAAFLAIGGRAFGIPVPVLIVFVVVVLVHVLLAHTLFGRHVRAIGGSPAAATLVGIPVMRRVLATFMISGALAALAGIVMAARVRNLDPTAGAGIELAALTAVVLGGTRLTGGRGDVLQSLAGALILGVVANAMRLLDYSYNLQLLLQGLVLITAAALDAYMRSADR